MTKLKRISILTVGTTGDVLPFISLAVALKSQGYSVQIVTSKNFEDLITPFNIDFSPLNFDMYTFLRTVVDTNIYTRNIFKFMYQAKKDLEAQMPQLLQEEWEALKESEFLIYHPLAFSAGHIAEKLNIPCVMVSTVPAFTPTKEFPAPVIGFNDIGILNKLSYKLIEFSILPYYFIINKWRKEVLKLKPCSLFMNYKQIKGKQIPVLYCYSPSVIPKPSDWDDNSYVTGYWFLDCQDNWVAPEELIDFINSGSTPFYAGFGSMVGINPEKITQELIKAFEITNQRCIIATGWGGITSIKVPDNIHIIESVPHNWLFPQVAGVIHHGGAGTTAAGLRAGKPTIICPFLLDQYFWGNKVFKMGLGAEPIAQKNFNATAIAKAIENVLNSQEIQKASQQIAHKIQSENGPQTAVEIINKLINTL